MRLGREYAPLAIFGALVVSSLASFPDKDMDWKNYSVTVRTVDSDRFLPVAAILAIPARVKAALPTLTGPSLKKRSIVTHRGFTHTVWFAFIIAGILGGLVFGVVVLLNRFGVQVLPYSDAVVVGFTFAMGWYGIIAHLLGDVITPSGIAPFGGLPTALSQWVPLSDWKISLNLVYASNMVWNYLLNVIGVASIILSFIFGDEQIANLILEGIVLLFQSVR